MVGVLPAVDLNVLYIHRISKFRYGFAMWMKIEARGRLL